LTESQGTNLVSNKLNNEDTLAEQPDLQTEAIVELLEVCSRTICFQLDDKLFLQKYGMAIGRFLSSIISKIYMDHFEILALDSAQHKPLLWLHYVDDIFVIWPHFPGGYRISSFTTAV
jgi:hypothetical protein